jgi:predicted S18 family serine protease
MDTSSLLEKQKAPRADGLCEVCEKNQAKYYRRKSTQHQCRYCWDREEYPSLAEKTDAEIDQAYEENYKRIFEKKKSASRLTFNS